ncbi:HNH endonuclease [Lusitaniella coriacea LEGE 07157]|uniref:HNH endonuclease n=1 Tax=Lusitaniella coriacea LEGE 07157 TaxID=945747 RepID=A0A8J7AR75_9CYAN|nr:HNH endonuclease [Lusitaniella coriacea]MBE9114491.1 HNH endonuclease [Lusitaniella coriacea LEGE 07157]
MTSVTQTLSQSVVVFSKNYLPISRINLRRAIVLLVAGKAEPVDFFGENGWEVRSPSLIFQVPAHIRLTTNSAERVWKIPPVNRREVLRRDLHTCQYCGSKKKLTLDHVIPRSKGGKHRWDNVVTACERCNAKKGDRVLGQVGMKLQTRPKAPPHPAVAFAEQFWREQQANLD